jgi:hypothetical protein
MHIPPAFKLHRIASIVSLLIIAVMLANMAWLLTQNGLGNQFVRGILIVTAFFFIQYKNAQTGLYLHGQLITRQPIPPRKRRILIIYWVLQVLLQIYVAIRLMVSLPRTYRILQAGLLDGYPFWALLSDILGLLHFIVAVTCLGLFWPNLFYARQHYHLYQQGQRSTSADVLEGFE